MRGIVISPTTRLVAGWLCPGDTRERFKGALKVRSLLVRRHRMEIAMLPGMQGNLVSVSHRSLNEIRPVFGRAPDPAIGRLDVEISQDTKRTLHACRVIFGLRNPVGVCRIAISLFTVRAVDIECHAERRPVIS